MRFEAQRQGSWAECIQHSDVEKVMWNNCGLSVCLVSKTNASVTQSGRQKPSKQQLGFPFFHCCSSQHFLTLLILFMSHSNLCNSDLSAVVMGMYFLSYFMCRGQFSVCRNMGYQLKPVVIWTDLFSLDVHKVHLIALWSCSLIFLLCTLEKNPQNPHNKKTHN